MAQTARRHDGNDNTGAKSRFRSPGESIKVETERRKEPESPTATCTRNCKALGRSSGVSQTLSISKRYIKGEVKTASIYEGRNVQLDRNTNRSIYITIHSALTNYDEQPKRGSRRLLSKS